MRSQSYYAADENGLSEAEIARALDLFLLEQKGPLKKVLLIPPDFTRLHSNAGRITQLLYQMLSPACRVDILPALGTHVPVSPSEWAAMFGTIPYDRMIVHHFRSDIIKVGEVPGDFVRQVSEGLMDAPIPVEINKHILDPSYSLILSIGQVVPHEVAGMANYTKNIVIGCGGADMISSSHMLGAFYGMERVMGRAQNPVRAVFDYAQEHFLNKLPLQYILTVTSAPGGRVSTHGLFLGSGRSVFHNAAKLAAKKNITVIEKPIQKAVVFLDEQEFKSTWLGNKAVYRTRMAIADGGELVILAPGVDKFGEDSAIDALIRKYGYRGREPVLNLVKEEEDLKNNLSAAAHLIHGSSEGRFQITYCTRHLTRGEVEGVGYGHIPYEDAVKRYSPEQLSEGWNTLPDGEEIYYISNPALGLWMEKKRME